MLRYEVDACAGLVELGRAVGVVVGRQLTRTDRGTRAGAARTGAAAVDLHHGGPVAAVRVESLDLGGRGVSETTIIVLVVQ